MIRFFNKLGNSWIAKVIFVALGLSMMAIWGLGGFLNTSVFSQKAPVQVGDVNFSMDTIVQRFNQERQNRAKLTGKYLSVADAIKAGVLDETIQQIVLAELQQQIRKQVGPLASEKIIGKYIERQPLFKDATGRFDVNIFRAYLKQIGKSEPELLALMEDELGNKHIFDTISGLAYVPEELVKVLYGYQYEQRDVAYIAVRPENIQIITEPTNDELKSYYEINADKFMSPQKRTLGVVELTIDTLANKVPVSDSEIDAVMVEKKDAYTEPERRQVAQIILKNYSEEDAKKFASTVTAQNFFEKAEELGQTDVITDFGWVAKTDILPELGDAIFAVKKGEVTALVPSALGYQIFYIQEVQAPKQMDTAVVRADIKKQLAAEKIYAYVQEIATKIENELGTGKKISDLINEYNLPVRYIIKTDVTGKAEEGTVAPLTTTVLQKAFQMGAGETSGLIEIDNGYLIVNVESIVEPVQQSFTEARTELVKLWKTDKQKEKMPAIAQEILNASKKQGALQAFGSYGHFNLTDKKNLTRVDETLPTTVVSTLFNQGQGIENAQIISNANEDLVAVVEKINTPLPAAADLKAIRADVRQAVADSLIDEWLKYYANEIKVVIDTPAIEKAFMSYLKIEE